MRKRYITSFKKLPIIILLFLVSFNLQAKKKVKETNIVCFAAQKQWICAPEDQQNIASEKAQKLIKTQASEFDSSEVVIRTLNMPKFNTAHTPQEPSNRNKNSMAFTSKQKPTSKPIKNEVVKPVEKLEVKIEPEKQTNPYAKLWSHQLIGVSTPQSAINFVKNNHFNRDDILIIKSMRADMDWWIVLYGLYKDRQTGVENQDSLPIGIQQPWLRPLKNLVIKGFIEKY